jgi:hypothetical protein
LQLLVLTMNKVRVAVVTCHISRSLHTFTHRITHFACCVPAKLALRAGLRSIDITYVSIPQRLPSVSI